MNATRSPAAQMLATLSGPALARTKRPEIQRLADGGQVRHPAEPKAPRAPRTGAALILSTMPASHAKAKAMEHGGAIRGPGTPTSDSVPIWASRDEFMLPADTAAAVGKENSVVREGEYATVANAPGMPERVKGWASYVAGGGKLTDEVKKQILTEAKSRMGTFDTEYGAARDRYSEIAKKSSADPSLVVPQDYKPAVAAPAAAVPALPPRENLVAGKAYQTARGTAVWDGKQFTMTN